MESQCATRWGAGLQKKIDLSGEFIKIPYPLPHCSRNEKDTGTPIQEFFRNSNVFITGGTGFVGKVLIEKLIASCPGIKMIFVVIREREGKRAQERLDELMNDNVFVRLQQTVPHYREKVTAVKGDISQPNIGLSEKDYKSLTDTINVVFHSAATVKFVEKLSESVRVNLFATREIIKFAKSCRNLKSIVHVSTAYTNPERRNVSEIFYPPHQNYKEILELLQTNPEELNRREKELIAPSPNTYCCTKKLAEDLIAEEGLGLPISVFRPAIVVPSYQEPTPAYTDNVVGPTAPAVATAVGVLRVNPIDVDNITCNFAPVDFAINALIAVAWKNAEKIRLSKTEIPIYNYTSEARNPMTWREFTKWNFIYGIQWITIFAYWYPVALFVTNPIAYKICFFLLHTLPAYIVDLALWISGRKTTMIKATDKMRRFINIMSYFISHNIKFSDENVVKLWESLDQMDQAIYPFDIAAVDWDHHAQIYFLGVRVHILKDPLETLDAARQKLKRLHILHRLFQFAFIGLVVWIFTLFWKSH